MAYDFNEAKDAIKTMLIGITGDDSQPLLKTVFTGSPGVLTLYMGNTAIFGLGDSKKANRPIGDRGSITSEGLLLLLTPSERTSSPSESGCGNPQRIACNRLG